MKRIFVFLLAILALNCYSQIPDGYYDSAEGLTGNELKSALHDIIDNHTEYDYGDLRYILDETDQDPDNSDNIILLYKGSSVSSEWDAGVTWNREHVWAKSHGDFGNDPPAGTDMHHIRPADPSVNSSRSDKDFDNGGTQHSEATECYYDSDSWEPRDAVKGDVARMMFYMAVRYEGDVSGEPDLELVDHVTTYYNPEFGVLSTLLEWHSQDPVDDFEINRNNIIYSYQNNRNPFVDHPEYVSAIFSSENSAPNITNQDFTIAENSANGTEVGTVEATDPDGDNLSYKITSGNINDAFELNETSGLLTVNNSEELDYETNQSYSLGVEVSDGSLAASATITVNVDNVNPIEPVANKTDISIFPNPVSSILTVDIPENYSLEFYSVIGEKLLVSNLRQVDLSSFKQGIYFVIVKNETGKSLKSFKILKK